MPRLFPVQNAFTTGEATPKLFGRVDLQKYYSACSALANYLVQHQGGVSRRPGTRFVKEVKTSSSTTIVRPFKFSTNEAYVLEFGATYVRFYKSGLQLASGGNAVEVTTPYAAADLRTLKFSQSADVLTIVAPDYAPRVLERYSDSCWKMRSITFTPPPSREYGHRPDGTLTPGALAGNGVTLTASTNAFLASDVGR